MDYTKLIAVALIAAVLGGGVSGVVAARLTAQTVAQGISQQFGALSKQPTTGFTNPVSFITKRNGTSNAIPQYVNYGGSWYAFVTQNFVSTSSAVCSIANPFASGNALGLTAATATPIRFIATQSSYALGANYWNLATSSNAYTTGTSTTRSLALGHAVASNVLDYYHWSIDGAVASTSLQVGVLPSHYADGSISAVQGPTEYLVYANGTSTPSASMTFSGTCSAVYVRN